jgi:hypothetical protein
MGVISGVDAAVDGWPCLKEWRIQLSDDLAVAFCSASGGAPVVSSGNQDWQGTAAGYGYEPPVVPGQKFQFTGALRGVAGSQHGVDSGANGAIVTKYVQKFPVAQAGYYWYEIHFASAASALTASETLTVTDSTTPSPVSPKGRYVDIGGNDVPIIQAELTVENRVAMYRDSDTGGLTGREEGNYYATWWFDMYFDDFDITNVPNIGVSALYQFDVTASLFWEVKNGVVRQKQRRVPIEGDQQSGRAEMATLRVSGDWDSSVTGGAITTPGLVVIWP